ncbi:hypothetical protein HG15A2_19120 [Adhaeretor mobilis]|uniref:Uncharacterized protein n=1 Tax=Adhaeretor mobilis TaxID=1930276 RepID=A0A517MUR9_9BACT|nr:hypothetical protein HG15A2_19120 [Adhaeretor mobilis]
MSSSGDFHVRQNFRLSKKKPQRAQRTLRVIICAFLCDGTNLISLRSLRPWRFQDFLSESFATYRPCHIEQNSNLPPSNKPRSLSFSSGITNSAMKESVM